MTASSSDFESILARIGLQPDDILAARNTHVSAPNASAIYIHEGDDSALWAHYVTVTSAEELRKALNPRDAETEIEAPASAEVLAGAAPPGASWSSRQHGRDHADQGAAMAALRAVVHGPSDAVAIAGPAVERAWLPARVTVFAAQSMNIAAGQVVVLGSQTSRATPFQAVFDTLTIEPGGQLVLASPTVLTITNFNRPA